MRFKKGEQELAVAEFADENAAVGDKVISLGNPSGQINAVTLGETLDYREVDPSSGENKIEFEVLVHTCPLEKGSSGGILINYDLKLVGINYAVASNTLFGNIAGLAIPLDKIKDFLDFIETN